jgi:hypothetical protein
MPKSLPTFFPNGKYGYCYTETRFGKAYRIPKNEVSNFIIERKDEITNKSAVYILIGPNKHKIKSYVGKTQKIEDRLNYHVDKNTWFEYFYLFLANDNINRGHISYLERRLYISLLMAFRCSLTNDIVPVSKDLNEADMFTMGEFLDDIEWVMCSNGYKIFKPSYKKINDKPVYFYNDAIAQPGEGKKFIILAKSIMPMEISKSFAERGNGAQIRGDLLKNKIVKEVEGVGLVFIENKDFSSPTAAADCVLGNSSMGPGAWKNEFGIRYK